MFHDGQGRDRENSTEDPMLTILFDSRIDSRMSNYVYHLFFVSILFDCRIDSMIVGGSNILLFLCFFPLRLIVFQRIFIGPDCFSMFVSLNVIVFQWFFIEAGWFSIAFHCN